MELVRFVVSIVEWCNAVSSRLSFFHVYDFYIGDIIGLVIAIDLLYQLIFGFKFMKED